METDLLSQYYRILATAHVSNVFVLQQENKRPINHLKAAHKHTFLVKDGTGADLGGGVGRCASSKICKVFVVLCSIKNISISLIITFLCC